MSLLQNSHCAKLVGVNGTCNKRLINHRYLTYSELVDRQNTHETEHYWSYDRLSAYCASSVSSMKASSSEEEDADKQSIPPPNKMMKPAVHRDSDSADDSSWVGVSQTSSKSSSAKPAVTIIKRTKKFVKQHIENYNVADLLKFLKAFICAEVLKNITAQFSLNHVSGKMLANCDQGMLKQWELSEGSVIAILDVLTKDIYEHMCPLDLLQFSQSASNLSRKAVAGMKAAWSGRLRPGQIYTADEMIKELPCDISKEELDGMMLFFRVNAGTDGRWQSNEDKEKKSERLFGNIIRLVKHSLNVPLQLEIFAGKFVVVDEAPCCGLKPDHSVVTMYSEIAEQINAVIEIKARPLRANCRLQVMAQLNQAFWFNMESYLTGTNMKQVICAIVTNVEETVACFFNGRKFAFVEACHLPNDYVTTSQFENNVKWLYSYVYAALGIAIKCAMEEEFAERIFKKVDKS